MGSANLRSGLMTAVSAANPTTNFDYQTKSAVRSGSPGDCFTYLYFARAFPLTATIVSAKLHLWTQSYTQTGTHSITATRLNQKVNFAKITYNTRATQLHGAGPSVSKSGAQGAASEWVFDITAQMQAVSNGDLWYGWRLSSDFNPAVYVYGPTYPNTAVRPWVEVTWADNPATPVGLSPAGGRAVNLSNPVLRAVYHDVSGNTTLQSVQVQLASTSTGFATPTWDSGTVATGDPELDLNTDGATHYPGLAVGATTWWRIRMQDGAGLWSAYSDPESFTRDDKGTLTVQNPPDPGGTGYYRQTYPAAQTANSTTGISYGVPSSPVDPTMTASPGDVFEVGVWMRSTLAKDLAPLVQFLDSTSTQISSTAFNTQTVQANVWTWFQGVSVAAPAGTVRVRILAYQSGSAGNPWWRAGDELNVGGFSVKLVGGTGVEKVSNPWGQNGLTYISSTAPSGTGAATATLVGTGGPAGTDDGPVIITDPTPPINWTFTGETQKSYQIFVQEAVNPAAPNRARPIWTTGKITSTVTSVTLPKGVLQYSGRTYNLTVRIWDTDSRESTPGDQVYVDVRRSFVYRPSSIVGAVSTLVVTQPSPPQPTVLLSWSRSTAPDSFTIVRNGRVIESGIDPLDVSTGSINYAWTDNTPSPQRLLTYEVRAVQNGIASKDNNKPTITLPQYGIWLRDLTSGDAIVISSNESNADFTLAEQTAVVQPIADNAPKVLLTQSQGVLEGSVSGYLLGPVVPGFTDQGMRDAYLRMRNTAGRQFYLTVGDYTFVVVANNFTYQQFNDAVGQTVYRVSFNFYQQDSLTSLLTAG
jgi:hypothetical protein